MYRFCFLCSSVVLISFTLCAQAQKLYVSPNGSDTQNGTTESFPKRTLRSALDHIEKISNSLKDTARILLLPGEYYLEEPLVIDHGRSHLSIEASEEGTAVIKGSTVLSGKWEHFTGDIMMLKTNSVITPFSNLYINGILQHLARYPNYDSTIIPFNGYAKDAISPAHTQKWKQGDGGIVHVMHLGEWGDFHYVIKKIDGNGKLKLEGGHQNNRPAPMHEKYRFVENIFDELDAPGEWFFDKTDSTLYVYPFDKVDLNGAKIEVTKLKQLFVIDGEKEQPIKNITIEGIRFEHTNRTFMEEYEPLLRSDWMIYRGGALVFENAENCKVLNCGFNDLGGNALFVSGYNRDITIQGNHIYDCGASAICFVGLPTAVRSPSFNYHNFVPLKNMDIKKGPKNNDYPSDCVVDNNLIHDIGKVEKQTAGVQLSMSMNITVRHNSIYDVPRAGINVSDGTWGGHVIEFNDVFNTVMETSDHGAFNSWGRDRFWHPDRKTMDRITNNNPEMPYWDAITTTVIRNNRMRCDHGWDIDLDDGSSNYYLYNNLCLNGGIKLREGFYRTVENNIMVNNGFHPHVWFKNSGDIFRKNIMMTGYKDIRLQGWGKEIDYNLFPDVSALEKAQQKGIDAHSNYGDPGFIDPVNGNFSLAGISPAIQLGFINFSMDHFGVQTPKLKEIAKSPPIPELIFRTENRKESTAAEWLGATIKNIETKEEQSASGLNEISGVLILEAKEKSLAYKGNLREGDVIVRCEDSPTKTINELLSCFQGNNWKGKLHIAIVRNQQEKEVTIATK